MSEKKIYERLHLDPYEDKNSEEYVDILNKVVNLDIKAKKNLFKVYDKLLGVLEERKKELGYDSSIREERKEEFIELLEDEDIVRYLEDRIESKNEIELNDVWKDRINTFKEEINELGLEHIIMLEIQAHTLKCSFETFILEEDDYWGLDDVFTLVLLRSKKFKFNKEKDRVWQPKTS